MEYCWCTFRRSTTSSGELSSAPHEPSPLLSVHERKQRRHCPYLPKEEADEDASSSTEHSGSLDEAVEVENLPYSNNNPSIIPIKHDEYVVSSRWTGCHQKAPHLDHYIFEGFRYQEHELSEQLKAVALPSLGCNCKVGTMPNSWHVSSTALLQTAESDDFCTYNHKKAL